MRNLIRPTSALWPLIALLIFISVSSASFAQKSALLTDESKHYTKAFELFQEHHYGAAREEFYRAKSDLDHDYLKRHEWAALEIDYFIALCSYELRDRATEKQLLAIVDKYPESLRVRLAWYHLGRYYFAFKKYKKAIEWFDKVDMFDLTTDEAIEYKFKFAYCYFYKKNFEEAKPLFESVKTIRSEWYYPANYYYGFIAYYNKDWPEALASFLNVEESKRYGNIVPYYICQIYYQQKRFDKIIGYGVKQLDNPNIKYFEEISLLVGQSHFKKEDYHIAIPFLAEYIDKAKTVRKEDVYQLGYAQYKTGVYQHAINNFSDLINFDDSLAQNASYNLADCYLKIERKEMARNAFIRAARMNFDIKIRELSMMNYAKLSYELGFHRESIRYLSKFTKEFPGSDSFEEAQDLLTTVLLSTRDYKEALRVFRAMEKKTPLMREAYQKIAYFRGVELYNDAEYDDADEHFDLSLENPIDVNYQSACIYWKAELNYKRGDYKKAIKNYDQFMGLSYLAKKLPPGVNDATANYGLAYAYYQSSEFPKAMSKFENAISSMKRSNDKIVGQMYHDAMLRAGDCAFLMKQYRKAIKYYSDAVTSGEQQKDYALFQQGILNGLLGKHDIKVNNLKMLTREYDASRYIDDAVYETANAFIELDQPDTSIFYFSKLIQEHPHSNFNRKAHLKMGLITYNQGDYKASVDHYREVITRYPKSDESREALRGLKDTYVALGDVAPYFEIIKEIPGAVITNSAEDSLTYMAAEVHYKNKDCTTATSAMSSYLEKFPDGFFIEQAHFYRAECLYGEEKYKESVVDYEFFNGRARSDFSEIAMWRAAKIRYLVDKDYAAAYSHFKALDSIAEYRKNKNDAVLGIMRTAYKLEKYEESMSYALLVLESDEMVQDTIEAYYYIAQASYIGGNMQQALRAFNNIAKSNLNEMGAESKYMIARIYVQQNDLATAKEKAYEVINQVPSYDYWVVKSFVILANIYFKTDQLFQAKATLESVIANYSGERQDPLEEAKSLLAEIEKEEAKRNKVKEEEESDSMQFDSLKVDIERTEDIPDSLQNEDTPESIRKDLERIENELEGKDD